MFPSLVASLNTDLVRYQVRYLIDWCIFEQVLGRRCLSCRRALHNPIRHFKKPEFASRQARAEEKRLAWVLTQLPESAPASTRSWRCGAMVACGPPTFLGRAASSSLKLAGSSLAIVDDTFVARLAVMSVEIRICKRYCGRLPLGHSASTRCPVSRHRNHSYTNNISPAK